MKRTIRKATRSDLPTVLELIVSGRRIMLENGNPTQWGNSRPSARQIEDDIASGHSYLLLEDGKAIATCALIPGPDATYAKIYEGHWTDSTLPYYVIHRVASLPEYHGVMNSILDYSFSLSDNIRIDTHRNNFIMQRCLHSYGFDYCGIIHLEDGDERLAYQKLFSR